MTDTAPNLELDWEEGLFRLVRGLVRRVMPSRRALPAQAVLLEPIAAKLGILASVCAGRPMTVVITEGVGGLRGDEILMPSTMSVLDTHDDNAELLLLRAALSGAVRRARPNQVAGADVRVVEGLWAVAEAVEALGAELAGFEPRWRALALRLAEARVAHAPKRRRARVLEGWRRDLLAGRPLPDRAEMLRALPRGLDDGPPLAVFGSLLECPEELAGSGGDDAQPSTGQEHAAPKKIHDVRRKLLDDTPEHVNPIIHTFEKVQTLDAHEGGTRHADGSDELDDQLEALEEVDLREVVRGGEDAQAILRADLTFEGDIPHVGTIQPAETGIQYDEWDFRRRAYLADWCTVYPTSLHLAAPEYGREVAANYRREIQHLYDRISVHRSRLADERRQLDGDHLDLDAVVDAAVDRAAGRQGTDRVYIRRSRQHRDLAAAVLIDVSLSTDSWVANRRVLDVAREATVVLGEVTHRLGDRLAIYAFASKTRNACRVFDVRGFDEPWSQGRDRLGVLEPQGYTRIGPAIRHAAAQLALQSAERRLLLVISDGKPTDYDKYEGRYGVSDIRMALREASRSGVITHALTIDTAARGQLSATFGAGAWHVMSDPAHLPRVMGEVYGRLTSG